MRCGLKQGDPLYPYLFLLVVDVLQRLIKQDGGLQHPLIDGVPSVVLQYADDTMIIMRADPEATARLLAILDMLASTTGLVINFGKSTLVPMHVDARGSWGGRGGFPVQRGCLPANLPRVAALLR